MSTFNNTYGSKSMFASVAIIIDKDIPKDIDVHTVTLTLNGQHGEFDLLVLGTDQSDDFTDITYHGIAHRSGGVQGFKRVSP